VEHFRFECATCGEVHQGLPAFGFDYPLPLLTIPEGERSERVSLTSDTCIIDEAEFYIRARLEIPVHGYEEPMSWGVWVSLSPANFARFEELADEPGREAHGPWFGWLCSAMPGYPDSLLKTLVHLQPVPMRPLVELEPTGHPLAVEQREGITELRARQIVQAVLHPE
jgi:hypothetical protein